MRDFYDIWMLLSVYEDSIDAGILKRAFAATCSKRGTEHLKEQAEKILLSIGKDTQLHNLWKSYQKKFVYAANTTYEDVIESAGKLLSLMK
jgi:hypothetical protein